MIQKALLVFLLIHFTHNIIAQEVFKLKRGEVVKGGEIVNSGSELGSKIIIDNESKKITYSPSSNDIKERVYKILGEKEEGELRAFVAVGRNHRGEYTITIIIDSFYKRIEFLLDETGNKKMVYTF